MTCTALLCSIVFATSGKEIKRQPGLHSVGQHPVHMHSSYLASIAQHCVLHSKSVLPRCCVSSLAFKRPNTLCQQSTIKLPCRLAPKGSVQADTRYQQCAVLGASSTTKQRTVGVNAHTVHGCCFTQRYHAIPSAAAAASFAWPKASVRVKIALVR